MQYYLLVPHAVHLSNHNLRWGIWLHKKEFFSQLVCLEICPCAKTKEKLRTHNGEWLYIICYNLTPTLVASTYGNYVETNRGSEYGCTLGVSSWLTNQILLHWFLWRSMTPGGKQIEAEDRLGPNSYQILHSIAWKVFYHIHKLDPSQTTCRRVQCNIPKRSRVARL